VYLIEALQKLTRPMRDTYPAHGAPVRYGYGDLHPIAALLHSGW